MEIIASWYFAWRKFNAASFYSIAILQWPNKQGGQVEPKMIPFWAKIPLAGSLSQKPFSAGRSQKTTIRGTWCQPIASRLGGA